LSDSEGAIKGSDLAQPSEQELELLAFMERSGFLVRGTPGERLAHLR